MKILKSPIQFFHWTNSNSFTVILFLYFSSNLQVAWKLSAFKYIPPDKNEETIIDLSKILGCKKDISTSTNLKNLTNAKKLKIFRSIFLPGKSFEFPGAVQHFKYDWREQYGSFKLVYGIDVKGCSVTIDFIL